VPHSVNDARLGSPSVGQNGPHSDRGASNPNNNMLIFAQFWSIPAKTTAGTILAGCARGKLVRCNTIR
jgi:hypothetical protein